MEGRRDQSAVRARVRGECLRVARFGPLMAPPEERVTGGGPEGKEGSAQGETGTLTHIRSFMMGGSTKRV